MNRDVFLLCFFAIQDFCYVSKSAKFRYPFLDLGISAEVSSSYLLPRRVGRVKATELFLLMPWFSGDDAVSWGLANECCADSELLATAFGTARRMALHPNQKCITDNKKLLNRFAWSNEFEEHMSAENKTICELMASEETLKSMMRHRERLASNKKKQSKLYIPALQLRVMFVLVWTDMTA